MFFFFFFAFHPNRFLLVPHLDKSVASRDPSLELETTVFQQILWQVNKSNLSKPFSYNPSVKFGLYIGSTLSSVMTLTSGTINVGLLKVDLKQKYEIVSQ